MIDNTLWKKFLEVVAWIILGSYASQTQTMYGSIYNRGLPKGGVDLYTINKGVSSSLINGITNFTIGKLERKIK